MLMKETSLTKFKKIEYLNHVESFHPECLRGRMFELKGLIRRNKTAMNYTMNTRK